MKQRKQSQRPRMLPETQWQEFWVRFTPEQCAKIKADLEFRSAMKSDDHLKAQAVAQYLINGVYETEEEKHMCKLLDELFPPDTNAPTEEKR